MIHKYQVYIFPRGKQSKLYMTKFALAGSQGRLSMITQVIEGKAGILHDESTWHMEEAM